MRTLRARLGLVFVGAIAVVVACNFNSHQGGGAVDDATLGEDDAPRLQDAYVADAGPCQDLGPTCEGPTLRTCTTINQLPTDTPCAWGCSTVGGAHCGKLQPSGGAVLPTDLDSSSGLSDISTPPFLTIDLNTDTGQINNVRNSGTGIKNGIDYIVRGNVAVFRFKKLTVNGRINIRGAKALAIVAIEGMTINNELDARGDCQSRNAGPGGFPGGQHGAAGGGATSGGSAGTGSHDNASGGGGGGYGAGGGSGGAGDQVGATTGGTTTGTDLIALLQGGGGGGGGGGGNGGDGGGGGGAVQLVSNGTIRVAIAGVNAGGCGGGGTDAPHGPPNPSNGGDGAGGGGAGGAILIESPAIELAAFTFLTVNGGGGGGATSNNNRDGSDADNSGSTANGGDGQNSGGDGGKGAADNTATGGNGQKQKNGGGGGGAVGRIRLNTYSGAAAISGNATLSPRLSTGTTTTQGTANVL